MSSIHSFPNFGLARRCGGRDCEFCTGCPLRAKVVVARTIEKIPRRNRNQPFFGLPGGVGCRAYDNFCPQRTPGAKLTVTAPATSGEARNWERMDGTHRTPVQPTGATQCHHPPAGQMTHAVLDSGRRVDSVSLPPLSNAIHPMEYSAKRPSAVAGNEGPSVHESTASSSQIRRQFRERLG